MDVRSEALRDRFLEGGLAALSDQEVLEFLLRCTGKNRNALAHTLLACYGSLSAVLNTPAAELRGIEGMEEPVTAFLTLLPQFYRRCRPAQEKGRSGNLPVILDCCAWNRYEVICQLNLDQHGKVLSCRRLEEGCVASAWATPRLFVESAVQAGASGVILAHNHPGGVALPSPEDCYATKAIRAALETVGIALLDHYIVAGGEALSMRESGYFP